MEKVNGTSRALFVSQARAAGNCLSQSKIKWDRVYTSILQRSMNTHALLVEEMCQLGDHFAKAIPVVNSWRLNERHYGALIGLSKAEAYDKMGPKVIEVRRSWDQRPPPMVKHPFYHAFNAKDSSKPHFDWQSDIWTKAMTIEDDEAGKRQIKVDKLADIPTAESLQDCALRVLPLWKQHILPRLVLGETVLIVAHSNTIRSMVKHIDNLDPVNVRHVTIPSAVPLLYSFAQDTVSGEIRPLGKPSSRGVRGRFLVTRELLELSLAASQNMELSENLDEGSEFKDAVRYALKRLQEEEGAVNRGGGTGCGDHPAVSTEGPSGGGTNVLMDPDWMTFSS